MSGGSDWLDWRREEAFSSAGWSLSCHTTLSFFSNFRLLGESSSVPKNSAFFFFIFLVHICWFLQQLNIIFFLQIQVHPVFESIWILFERVWIGPAFDVGWSQGGPQSRGESPVTTLRWLISINQYFMAASMNTRHSSSWFYWVHCAQQHTMDSV